jgi:hypothetical protein
MITAWAIRSLPVVLPHGGGDENQTTSRYGGPRIWLCLVPSPESISRPHR